jgi:hypothetical protein
MLKRSLETTLVALAAAMLVCLPAFADSQARIVRLSNVEGSVVVDRNSGPGYEKAFLNMPVVQDMKVATKDGGRAEVEFEDGSTIRIGPKSTIEFSALSLRDSGARVSTMIVEAGLAYFNYTNSHKGDEFTVLFQNETARPQEAAHFRVDVQGLDVVLATFNGNVKVEGASGDVEVGKNKSATFDLTENNKFTVAKDIEELPLDAWDKSQTRYQQAYANKGSYNSYPYTYGVSDLNYYGNYYNVPGYGMMWQPYFTGAGWDPFMDGAWMFYPGSGYMWVSSYPWGWMPYRYGAWNFVPGYGWMWAPGGFNTWYPVTPVRNPPTRFTTPQPPVRGTSTVTVGRSFVGTGVPQRNLLIKSGSAGLGIPRGGVNNLNKVSRQVQQNGTMTVRSAPPARTTFGGPPSAGWGAPSSAGRMGGSASSSHAGGSSPHMGGSSGGHSSAPPSRSPR